MVAGEAVFTRPRPTQTDDPNRFFQGGGHYTCIFQDVAFFLNSADWACACSPSPNASVAEIAPSDCAPCAETWIRLLRFWKSYTPSGEEKRAVPEVGRT